MLGATLEGVPRSGLVGVRGFRLTSKMNTSQAVEKLKSESDRGKDADMLTWLLRRVERGIIKSA